MPDKMLHPSPIDCRSHPMNEIPVAYYELDLEGKITFANLAAGKLQNLSQDELLGQTAWQFMSPRDIAESLEQFSRVVVDGVEAKPVRRSFFTASGEFRVHELHYNVMHDETRSTTGLRVVMFDVTEAQLAHEEAQQNHLWLDSVLTSLTEAVIVTDALGFVRVINPVAERLTGWPANEIIGHTIEQSLPILFYCAISQRPLSFREALDGVCKGTAVVLNHFGEQIHVEINASPIIEKEHGCTTGVVSVWRRL